MIETSVTHSPLESELPGVIGRVWGVDGVTMLPPDLSTAHIVISSQPGAHDRAIDLALLHEYGHRDTFSDMVDGLGPDAPSAARAIDRWHSEVEAWIRGFEGYAGSGWLAEPVTFRFAFDCLNTYRRALRVSDELWQEAVDLLLSYFEGTPEDYNDLAEYEPNEPDPNDEPPACGSIGGEPWGEGDEGGGEDEGDGAEGDEGDAEPAEGEGEGNGPGRVEDMGPLPPYGYGPDMRWLRQDVIDALRNGRSVEDVGAEYGLPTERGKLPPLARAFLD